MKTNNFNRIADFYELLSYAVFGNALKQSQLCFMELIPSHATVLIVGDGNGWFLYNLLRKTHCRKIISVESSLEMTQLSQKRIASLSYETEVKFITNTLENIVLEEQFDVIVTPYFLDVFEESHLRTVMKQLSSHLKDDGLWLMTDFKINRHAFHSYWQIPLVKAMYLFFRIVSNIETTRLLAFPHYFQELGLKRIAAKDFYSGMIESVVYKHTN